LLKKGYSQTAADSIIRDLRDTREYVDAETAKMPRGGQLERESTSGPTSTETKKMLQTEIVSTPAIPASKLGERELFSYDFEPAGSLRLLVSSDVDTSEALDVLSDLVEMKRRELARKSKMGPTETATSGDIGALEDDNEP